MKLWRPPHFNSMATLPNKTNTNAKINVTCSFYWLYCLIDSHKRKSIAQPRLLLNETAMFDTPTAILDNTSKTTTPFIDTTVSMKRCDRFLPRVTILTRDIGIANLSVRSSVCYVPISDENGLTYPHSFFHHTVAKSFCFYQHQTTSRNSDGITPCGALNTGEV